jgi:tape measure domain-containing protein
MAKINLEDIFGFQKAEQSIQRLESVNQKYTQSTLRNYESLKKGIDEYIAKLKQLETALKSINVRGVSSGGGVGSAITADIDKTIASIDRYKTALATIDDVSKLNERSIAELKVGLGALKVQYENLDPASQTFASDQKRIADQVAGVTKVVTAQSAALVQAKKATDDANGSYNKLNKQTTDLKNQLRAMPGAINESTGAINKNNAAAVQMQKQIQANDKALKAFDSSIGNHQRNVGNYSSAMGGLGGSLKGALGSVIGITTAFEALAQSIRIIDQFTRLKLGLDAISVSSQQAAQRFEFVSNIADKTGQDIVKLTENYVSFTAAARSTTLEGKAGDKVFAAFSNSFAALGKSSEVAERGLYAVQQMISKGKVSSEELNQQLAEALPGANKLFADALGVSTAALADLMKKGEVSATDILPKVAAALEKIYGDRAQKNVTTISGSWNRVTNQTKLFLEELNKTAGIDKFFARINNGIADTIKGFTLMRENSKEVTERFESIKQNQSPLSALLPNALTMLPQLSQAATKVAKENEFLQQSVAKATAISDPKRRIDIILKEQNDLTRLSKAYQDQLDISKNTVVRTEEQRKKTLALSDSLALQKRLVEELGKAEVKRNSTAKVTAPKATGGAPTGKDEDPADKSKRVLTEFEKLTAEADKLSKVIADDFLADFNAGRELEISGDVLNSWNALFARIEAVSKALGQNVPADLNKLNNQINRFTFQTPDTLSPVGTKETPNNLIKNKTSKLAGLPTTISEGAKDTDQLNTVLDRGKYKKFLDEDKDALRDQLAEINQLKIQSELANNKAEKEGVEERIRLAEDEYSRKLELARIHAEERKKIEEAITEVAQASVNAAFEIFSNYNNAEIESNNAKMQHELDLVKGNAEAEDRIKKEYGKKDLALRQKQAKADKAQAAFNIILNTAVAVSKASPVVPLMVLAAALGVVQLAVVLSKPLPQYYKGTSNAEEGLAQVAERGPEIRESKGKMMLYDKPQVAYLNSGDKIYTAQQTQQMLTKQARFSDLNEVLSRSEISQKTREDVNSAYITIMSGQKSQEIDYNKMAEIFMDAIGSLPINQTIFDERGYRNVVKTKNSTTEYLDQRFRLKS